jgi:hypothetical protein
MKHIALRAFAITLLSFSCIPTPAQVKESQLGLGDEWLSWKPEHRQGYVYGYVDGYLGGTLSSCHAAEDLFGKDKAHTLGNGKHATDTPFARCIVRRGEFSKLFSDEKFDNEGHLDVSVYTKVITEFYEKHGNCRDYPFSMLMEHLASKYSTADELYEAASHGLLKGRSRQWCGLDTTPPDK